jgi:hypothetical protein
MDSSLLTNCMQKLIVCIFSPYITIYKTTLHLLQTAVRLSLVDPSISVEPTRFVLGKLNVAPRTTLQL